MDGGGSLKWRAAEGGGHGSWFMVMVEEGGGGFILHHWHWALAEGSRHYLAPFRVTTHRGTNTNIHTYSDS